MGCARAVRDPAAPGCAEDLCRSKPVGASLLVREKPSAPEIPFGIRYLDAVDSEVAPILRGRGGEDVCAPPPTAWQTLASLMGIQFR
jgi:hypothetical protein